MNNKTEIKLHDYMRGYSDGVQATCKYVLQQLEGLNEIMSIDGKELMKIIIEGSR